MQASIEVSGKGPVRWTRTMEASSHAAGWGAVFLWAAAPILFKVCALEAPLPFILTLRFFISLLLLSQPIRELLQDAGKLPRIGVLRLFLWLGFNFYFQSTALNLLPASVYVIVFSLVPLFSLFVLRLKISRFQLGLAAVATLGCLLLLENGASAEALSKQGIVFLAVGMLGWVFFTREFSALQAHLPDLQLSALTHVGMLLVSLIWWATLGLPVARLSIPATCAVVILGISSPAAFFLFSYALRRAKIFAILSQYCEPAFGVVLASVVLGERLASLQWIGALLIFMAVVGTTRHR